MGKALHNNSFGPHGCSMTTKKCITPILIRHKKSKANGKKTVRFNIQGRLASSKRSEMKQYVDEFFTQHSKIVNANNLKSQSCIGIETHFQRCLNCRKNAQRLMRPNQLSTTNCNTNSGLQYCRACLIDTATARVMSLDDVDGSNHYKIVGAISCPDDFGTCNIRASHSPRNNLNSMNNDSTVLNHNGQAQLFLEDDSNVEIDKISPPVHSVSSLIRDLSNVTMESAVREANGMTMSRDNSIGVTCGAPPNSPLLESPMEEDKDPTSGIFPTMHHNFDQPNSNNSANNRDCSNHDDESCNDGSDLFGDIDLNENFHTVSVIIDCLDPTQDPVLRCLDTMNGSLMTNSIGITSEPPLSACPILNCGLRFDDVDRLRSHVAQLHHSPCNPLTSLPNGVLPQACCFLCPACGLTSQERGMCLAHMVSSNHLPLMPPVPFRVFACPQCFSFFPSFLHTRRHMDSVAHHTPALAFKGDLVRPTEAAPIPVPDRVVDMLISSCQKVPQTLFCLESGREVTSVDQLVILLDEGHFLSANCSKTLTDVLATLVTDQACAECSQMIIGGEPDLCIHISCPMNGPVLTMEPKSLCSFIRRCGIADVMTFNEHNSEQFATIATTNSATTDTNNDVCVQAESCAQSPTGGYLLSYCSSLESNQNSDCDSHCPRQQYQLQDVLSHSPESVLGSYHINYHEENVIPQVCTVTRKPDSLMFLSQHSNIDDVYSKEYVFDEDSESTFREDLRNPCTPRPKRAGSSTSTIASQSSDVVSDFDVPLLFSLDAPGYHQVLHTTNQPLFEIINGTTCIDDVNEMNKASGRLGYLKEHGHCNIQNVFAESNNSDADVLRMPLEMSASNSNMTHSNSYMESGDETPLPEVFDSHYCLASQGMGQCRRFTKAQTDSQRRHLHKSNRCIDQSKWRKRRCSSNFVEDDRYDGGDDNAVDNVELIKCAKRYRNSVAAQKRILRNETQDGNTANVLARNSPNPSYRVIARRRDFITKRFSKVLIIESVVDDSTLCKDSRKEESKYFKECMSGADGVLQCSSEQSSSEYDTSGMSDSARTGIYSIYSLADCEERRLVKRKKTSLFPGKYKTILRRPSNIVDRRVDDDLNGVLSELIGPKSVGYMEYCGVVEEDNESTAQQHISLHSLCKKSTQMRSQQNAQTCDSDTSSSSVTMEQDAVSSSWEHAPQCTQEDVDFRNLSNTSQSTLLTNDADKLHALEDVKERKKMAQVSLKNDTGKIQYLPSETRWLSLEAKYAFFSELDTLHCLKVVRQKF